MENTVVDIQRNTAFRIIVDHAAAIAAGKMEPRKIGVIQRQVAGVVDRSPIGVDGAVPLEIEVFQHDIRAGVDRKDPPAGGSGDGDNVFSVAAQEMVTESSIVKAPESRISVTLSANVISSVPACLFASLTAHANDPSPELFSFTTR